MKTTTYEGLVPVDYISEASLDTSGLSEGLKMKADDVRYIVIHCSATRPTQDYTAQQLESDHRRRGFRTGGYHFYVRRDGTVSQFRRLLEKGAHCKGSNHNSIGICYEGGLDRSGAPADTVTAAQDVAIAAIIDALRAVLPHLSKVRGHRDMPRAATDCPCLDAGKKWGGEE